MCSSLRFGIKGDLPGEGMVTQVCWKGEKGRAIQGVSVKENKTSVQFPLHVAHTPPSSGVFSPLFWECLLSASALLSPESGVNFQPSQSILQVHFGQKKRKKKEKKYCAKKCSYNIWKLVNVQNLPISYFYDQCLTSYYSWLLLVFSLILCLKNFEGVQWNSVIILNLTSVVIIISFDTSLEFTNVLFISFTIATVE